MPIEILYDRMKTAVTGEDGEGHIIYNRALLALAQHYGFQPKACRPYRAKTKGKVERPFSYIRQDFFLARHFRNLDDLNAQLRDWLDTVANVRLHGTTQRIVAEAFAAEQPELAASARRSLRCPAQARAAGQPRRARVDRRQLLQRSRSHPAHRRGASTCPTRSAFSIKASWWPCIRCSKAGASPGSIRRIGRG